MKNHPEKYWLGAMILLLIIFLMGLFGNLNKKRQRACLRSLTLEQKQETKENFTATLQRKNIVFILGKDKNGDNTY